MPWDSCAPVQARSRAFGRGKPSAISQPHLLHSFRSVRRPRPGHPPFNMLPITMVGRGSVSFRPEAILLRRQARRRPTYYARQCGLLHAVPALPYRALPLGAWQLRSEYCCSNESARRVRTPLAQSQRLTFLMRALHGLRGPTSGGRKMRPW